MVTLARIFEAWMNAEQFDFPIDPRSLLWHLLKIPHYGFAIFSLWTYRVLSKNNYLALTILLGDIIIAWFAFEFFLEFFRQR